MVTPLATQSQVNKTINQAATALESLINLKQREESGGNISKVTVTATDTQNFVLIRNINQANNAAVLEAINEIKGAYKAGIRDSNREKSPHGVKDEEVSNGLLVNVQNAEKFLNAANSVGRFTTGYKAVGQSNSR